ncbi:MAG: TolC family protein, partial [Bacteroidota bacterium]
MSSPQILKAYSVLRILLLVLFSGTLFGQSAIDEQKAFTLDTYLEWIRKFHPLAQQARLLDDQARAQLMEARGSFDPKLFGEYEDKSFDDKNYFRVGESGLKIPTWWGADIKLAYTWSSGIFLNPANSLPENGQAVLGIDIPLMRGLFFDERRAQVQLAKQYREANEAKRRSMLNDFLLKAIETYWQWAYQYQVVQVYETSFQLANDRFRIIKTSFVQGDLPAIDTLESMIQVQDREVLLQQARIDFDNAGLEMANFLWTKDLIPLELSDELRPNPLVIDPGIAIRHQADNNWLAQVNAHPDLQKLTIEQENLEIKRKLKREQFNPKLNFNYNFLGDG